MKQLTTAQIRRYFEIRLDGTKLPATSGVVRCPFHDDRTASLSLNMQKGVWKCHAGCGEGGLREFEMKYAGGDSETAWASVLEVIGEKQMSSQGQKPEAVVPVPEQRRPGGI